MSAKFFTNSEKLMFSVERVTRNLVFLETWTVLNTS